MKGPRTKPRVLFYDIETSPNLGYTWAKYDQNVIEFLREWQLLSVAYKWQGGKTVRFVSRQGRKNDKNVVRRLHSLFKKADLIVAHNGDEFDQKKVKTRFLHYKLPPPKVLCSVDTKKAARSYFRFNSNSLDDLCASLKLGRKVKTPGFDLWTGCMADDPKSWRIMETYNKRDVVLLERLYDRLRPWIQNHPTLARALNPHMRRIGVCPGCGSKRVHRRGFRATQTRVQQQWTCRKREGGCGMWFLTRVPAKGDLEGLRGPYRARRKK